jgi:hypothetical protein
LTKSGGGNDDRLSVAILQSCYIPWKGYFDLIGSVDVFVIYDDVQYSKNHWHNRNQIKTQHGLKWVTIPVSKSEGAFPQIDQVRIAEPFARKHWASIAQAYAKAPFFKLYAEQIEALFLRAEAMDKLSDINAMFLVELSKRLGFETRIVMSNTLVAAGRRTDRLLSICQELGAGLYLSGPSAKDYFEGHKFEAAGIGYTWMDYGGYQSYPQLHGDFEGAVTVLDLLFNTGPNARRYMKAPVGLY